MNDGETSASAYDTAWVARIPSIDDAQKPQFPTTLNWILTNQHEDGSWGESSFFLLYDRLVCTLTCVLALIKWKIGKDQVEKGTFTFPFKYHSYSYQNGSTSLHHDQYNGYPEYCFVKPKDSQTLIFHI